MPEASTHPFLSQEFLSTQHSEMMCMAFVKNALHNLTLRSIVLYLIGGAIQVTPMTVLLFDLFGSVFVPKLSTTETVILSAGVFLIGICYCVFATFATTPKRFFTPTLLQTATWSFMSAVYLVAIFLTNPLEIYLLTMLSTWTQDVIVSAFLLAAIAVGQFFITRFLVGRNGMANDVVCIGFQVPLPFPQVLEKIEKIGRHPYLGWEKHYNRTSHHTFKLWVAGVNYVLLIVAPDLKHEDKTLIALANFDLFFTTIAKSPYAEDALETIKTNLTKLLKCEPAPLDDDKVIRIAENEALEPTRPRSISWARISTDVRRMIGALAALIVAMVVLWNLKILGDLLFYEFIVFLALDMVFVGVPAISEKISESRAKV
jgi:hypothetical protein